MHHKVMIIDGHILVTGSYNWSQSAEDDNDENIIVIDSNTRITRKCVCYFFPSVSN